MSDQYEIQFTNSNSGVLTLDPYHVDGPVHPAVIAAPFTNGGYPPQHQIPSTSLVFYGKGISNYGPRVQQNFLNLLENFANPTEPVSPVIGQLWYNSDLQHTYSYNGVSWVSILGGSTGGIINGQLIIEGVPTEGNHVATKDYVDAQVLEVRGGLISCGYSSISSILTISQGANVNSVLITSVESLTLAGTYDVTSSMLTLALSNGFITDISIPILDTTTISSVFDGVSLLTISLSNGSSTSVVLPTSSAPGTGNGQFSETITTTFNTDTNTLTTSLGSGAVANVIIPTSNAANITSVYDSVTGTLTTALSTGSISSVILPVISDYTLTGVYDVAVDGIRLAVHDAADVLLSTIVDVSAISDKVDLQAGYDTITGDLSLTTFSNKVQTVNIPNANNIVDALTVTTNYTAGELSTTLSNGSTSNVTLPDVNSAIAAVSLTNTFDTTTRVLTTVLSNGATAAVDIPDSNSVANAITLSTAYDVISGVLISELSNGSTSSVIIPDATNLIDNLVLSSVYDNVTEVLTSTLTNGSNTNVTIPNTSNLSLQGLYDDTNSTLYVSLLHKTDNVSTLTLSLPDINALINNLAVTTLYTAGELTTTLSNGSSSSVIIPDVNALTVATTYDDVSGILSTSLANGSSSNVTIPSINHLSIQGIYETGGLNLFIMSDSTYISQISVAIPDAVTVVNELTISNTYDNNTGALTSTLSNGNTSTVLGFKDPVVPITQTIITTDVDTNDIIVPTYSIGYNRLWVFKNGIKQYMGLSEDYVETDNTTITFNTLIPAGTKFEILNL